MILATLILFPGFILLGQDTNITKEINEQVWMTFIRSYGNGDQEQFKSVHSKDVVRVIRDDGQIIGYDQYFKKNTGPSKSKVGQLEKEHRTTVYAAYIQ